MATIEEVAAEAATECFVDEYQREDNATARQREGLGIKIAAWCLWDGLAIMQVFQAALEDANFHTEAAQIREWIEKGGG